MLCLNLRSEIKNRIFEKLENYRDTTEEIKIDNERTFKIRHKEGFSMENK